MLYIFTYQEIACRNKTEVNVVSSISFISYLYKLSISVYFHDIRHVVRQHGIARFFITPRHAMLMHGIPLYQDVWRNRYHVHETDGS